MRINKTILWLVGNQQAGKTTFTKLFNDYDIQCLNIGESLRTTITPEQFAQQSNPYAPEFVEKTVQGMIYNAISEFQKSDLSLLVIDSAPRNMQQFKIVKKMNGTFNTTVMFILEKTHIRTERARKKYGDSYINELFLKREPFEKQWLDELAKNCDDRNINRILIGKQ